MDLDRVLGIGGVSPAEDAGDGNAPCAAFPDGEPVALVQAFLGELERSELITLVRVGPGLIDDEVRPMPVQDLRNPPGDVVHVHPVPIVVIEADIQIAALLGRIQVFLVDREGINVRVFGEDEGRTVSLMEVAVDHHGPVNAAFALQAADGNGEIVQVAESFGLVGKAVVKPAGQVERAAVLERQPAREDGPPRGEVVGVDDLFGDGKLGGEGPEGVLVAPQVLQVFRGVSQERFLFGGRNRSSGTSTSARNRS